MGGRGRVEVAGRLVEGVAAAQRGKRLGEAGLTGGGVVDGAAGHDGQAQAAGGDHGDVVRDGVLGQVVVGEFGIQAAAEDLAQALKAVSDRGDIAPVEAGSGAAGQDRPMAAVHGHRQRVQVVDGGVLGRPAARR